MRGTESPRPRSLYGDMLRTTLGFAALGIVWIGSTFLLAWLIRSFAPFLIEAPWINTALNTVPLYGIALPVLLLICGSVPKTPIPKHRLSFAEFTLLFAPMFTFVIIGSLMGNLVTTVMDLLPFFDTGGTVDSMLSGGDLLWASVSVLIVAPIMEEIVFRKTLIPRLLVLGEIPAILVSGLFFGLFHMNFEQFFYAFFLGVIFGWIFVKTGKLIYTVLLHLVVNLFAGIVPTLLALLVEGSLTNAGANIGTLLLLSYSLAQYVAAGLGILVICLFCREIFRSVRRSPYPLGAQVRLLYANPGTVVMVAFCSLMFLINMLSF